MTGYGTKLKNLIKDSGYTLKQISEKIEVPASTIASWYKSEYPPLEAIIKMCCFLKINLWEFFINDNEDLKNILPDYIKPEDAALFKLLNNDVDISIRIEVKKLMVQTMKVVLSGNVDKLKDKPEYKMLFGD